MERRKLFGGLIGTLFGVPAVAAAAKDVTIRELPSPQPVRIVRYIIKLEEPTHYTHEYDSDFGTSSAIAIPVMSSILPGTITAWVGDEPPKGWAFFVIQRDATWKIHEA